MALVKKDIKNATKEQVETLLTGAIIGINALEFYEGSTNTTKFEAGFYKGTSTDKLVSADLQSLINNSFTFETNIKIPETKITGKNTQNLMANAHNSVYIANSEFGNNFDKAIRKIAKDLYKQRKEEMKKIKIALDEIWYMNEKRELVDVIGVADAIEKLGNVGKWENGIQVRKVYDSVNEMIIHLKRSYNTGIIKEDRNKNRNIIVTLGKTLEEGKVNAYIKVGKIPVWKHFNKVEPSVQDIYKGLLDYQLIAENLIKNPGA